MANKGRTFELDTVHDIVVDTDQRFVHAAVPDHSGNARDTYYDLEVIWPQDYHGHCHGAFIELKKRSGDEGKRVSVMSGGNDDETGKEELERLIEGTPNWGDAYVCIKFDHREIIVLHAEYLLKRLEGDVGGFDDAWSTITKAEEKTHGARLTPSDSISMVKPCLSYWESSTAGLDDHRKILYETGVPDHCIQPFELDSAEAATA
ncbi:hypothetical protein [Natrinema sp. DC36]|uniref:hypothetical protein n=1 Tax=Natrinema sp. DC36 TaxID=2878680 RepID=UPI001CF07AB4|nr:hypothetical protein [Natrinema sp. DC36]